MTEIRPARSKSGIILVVPRPTVRGWVRVLADELAGLNVSAVQVRCAFPGHATDPLVLERLEKWLGMSHTRHLGDFITIPLAADWPEPSTESIWIDLTETPGIATVVPPGAFALKVRFGQGASLASFVAAAHGQEPVHIGIDACFAGSVVSLSSVRIAVPDTRTVSRMVDAALARAITLIVSAVKEHQEYGRGRAGPTLPPSFRSYGGGYAARHLHRGYGRWIARKMRSRKRFHEHWQIAMRRIDEPRTVLDLDLATESFSTIPSANGTYFADPFLFRQRHETYLFFEEYVQETRRAHISFVVLEDEAAFQPRIALRCDHHLSYPFVFEYAGDIFMMPETARARRIQLYRATRFPTSWELCAVLIDGISAADATLHWDECAGLWWMFTSTSEHGGSDWDTLSIFYSETPFGPWRGHPHNPVKVDVTSSRPGGRLIVENGALYRIAQDCWPVYGAGLAVCRIEELTTDHYSERVVARYGCDSATFRGIHTYNRSPGWEAIDLRPRHPPRIVDS